MDLPEFIYCLPEVFFFQRANFHVDKLYQNNRKNKIFLSKKVYHRSSGHLNNKKVLSKNKTIEILK